MRLVASQQPAQDGPVRTRCARGCGSDSKPGAASSCRPMRSGTRALCIAAGSATMGAGRTDVQEDLDALVSPAAPDCASGAACDPAERLCRALLRAAIRRLLAHAHIDSTCRVHRATGGQRHFSRPILPDCRSDCPRLPNQFPETIASCSNHTQRLSNGGWAPQQEIAWFQL